jgi:hypothetical protein
VKRRYGQRSSQRRGQEEFACFHVFLLRKGFVLKLSERVLQLTLLP